MRNTAATHNESTNDRNVVLITAASQGIGRAIATHVARSSTVVLLARSESMRPQSMSSLLFALEKLGLVERQDHPNDRRQVVFSLTPAGAVSDKRRRAARQEWLIEAISSLERLNRLGRRVLTARSLAALRLG